MMNAVNIAVRSFDAAFYTMNRFVMNDMCKECNQLSQFSQKVLSNFPADFIKDRLDHETIAC